MGRLAKRIGDRRVLGLIRRYLGAGIHGQRGGDGAARGNAARRTLVTAASQRAARRSGQGAGETRARIRALRRRLQRIRAVAASGRARDEAAAAALRGTPAPNQRSEKRGGPGVAPENPGLLILGGPERDGEAPGGRQSPCHDEDRVRLITRRSGGRSIEQVCKRLGEYLRGWKEYFGLAETPASLRTWTNGFATAYEPFI
jgi:hypothetical protein